VSYNGSGTFSIDTSGQPVVSGTTIDPTVFNNLTADLATGLSTAITKDGQTTVTAHIPMSGYKITGIGAGTARTDAASLATIQDGTGVYVATVGGTADVITLTPSPAIASYTAGQTFRFIASGANTTNVTVNVSSLGAKAITKNGTTALAAGDIASGQMVTMTYDGTRFILTATSTATLNSPTITSPTITGTTSIGAGATLTSPTLAGTPTIPDNVFTICGSADATKKAAFEVDGITTATTRTITVPDANVDLTLVRAATTSVSGVAELATSAEVQTGTDTDRVPSVDALRNGLIVSSGVQATTSGSTFDFTIPAWAKRIVLEYATVSSSGTDTLMLQLGDAGGIETTGYNGAYAVITSGASPTNSQYSTLNGLIIGGGNASLSHFGRAVLELLDSATNTWSYSCIDSTTGTNIITVGSGMKATSQALTTVRLMQSAAGTFDSGSVNVLYS